jgi:thymidylate synthase (FAD)
MAPTFSDLSESKNLVDLVWSTPEAEKIVAFCARVSSPKNQENFDTAPKLIAYCIKHGHWSVLEQANMCVQINTGRDVAPQILRHRSFSFQEFSQRYAEADSFIYREARKQDLKNRQNSTDDLASTDKIWFDVAQQKVLRKG